MFSKPKKDKSFVPNNSEILFGGGGNLIGIYQNCEQFIIKNCKRNKITILPHTIKDIDHLLINPEIIQNVTFICREKLSFDYVKNFTNNVYLSKDMAFYINPDFIQQCKKDPIYNIGYCFRTDIEQTKVIIPIGNVDISISNHCSKHNLDAICSSFFNYLSQYKTIHTNRLHVGIAASLLGIEVYIYSNSYYKVEAVYNFSIKDKYDKSYFIKDE